MLGREGGQGTLAEAYLWTGRTTPLIDPKTFYARFAQVRAEILKDDDFAHWYKAGGRPSVPPSRVAGAFLLALREGCSDREAEQRMSFDLRWKWALGLDLGDHGCDHTTICLFRARLLAHEDEGRLFREILQRAVEKGLLARRAVQVIDSSPMMGAAATQDTYRLLRTALHKVVKSHGKHLAQELRPRLNRYQKTGKPVIDWEDATARKRELNQLVSDAELVLQELTEDGEGPTAREARDLLKRVSRQDVEEDGEGGVKIRQGVAKDRVISTVDADMRHGRKSSAGKWDGYKKHLTEEPQSELITAVEVSAANVSDGEMAMTLLEQQVEVGLAPEEVVGDQAYAAGALRAQAQDHQEGTAIVTKAPILPDSDHLPKSEFAIDLEAGTVTCPAGQVARFHYRRGHATEAVFGAAVCALCPLFTRCVSRSGIGRTINIHPYEAQLQAARERREQPDFDDLMRLRPTVERKQAHWNSRGGRRSRYFSLPKVRLQAFWTAAVVNLERMMVLDAGPGGRVAAQAA